MYKGRTLLHRQFLFHDCSILYSSVSIAASVDDIDLATSKVMEEFSKIVFHFEFMPSHRTQMKSVGFEWPVCLYGSTFKYLSVVSIKTTSCSLSYILLLLFYMSPISNRELWVTSLMF